MKKKEKASLHGMTVDELGKRIKEMQDKLVSYNVDRYTKQSKNLREGKMLRKHIAILKTLVRQKELAMNI